MDRFDIRAFGELNAENYDVEHDPGTTDQCVALIAELAGPDRVLELAIGTGRIAIPLSKLGFLVDGIDASPAMLEKLKAKQADAPTIETTVADMANFNLDRTYDFAYLVFNTLLNLTSQAAQVACFQNTAQHLNSGGRFLVETIVPDIAVFTDNQYLRTDEVSFNDVRIEAATHDPVSQLVECQRIRISAEGTSVKPFVYRYAWPSEIDLMANLAGLKLVDRWGDWQRGPFTPDSAMHISVYEKTPS
jgi:SAM-dependent methyltransferase